MDLIIDNTVNYTNYENNRSSRIWTINGQEIELRLPANRVDKLRENILLLKLKLENNEPLYDVVETLVLYNTMKIIQQYFLEDYLTYLHQHFIKKENEGIQGTFDSFMKECIDVNMTNPNHTLGKHSKDTIRETMISYITDGRVQALDIKKKLLEGLSLVNISTAIGRENLLRLLFPKYHSYIGNFIDIVLKEKSNNRELPAFRTFYKEFIAQNDRYSVKQAKEVGDYIEKVFLAKYQEYAEILIKSNGEQFDFNNNKWVFFRRGNNLIIYSNTVCFDEILSDKFKIDLKYFYRDHIKNLIRTNKSIPDALNINQVIKALNVIYQRKSVKCFGEIKNSDAQLIFQYLANEATGDRTGNQLSILTVAYVMTKLRQITDFLIEKQYNNHKMPKVNYFRGIKMHNIKKMSTPIDVIPNSVMEQLDTYKHHLMDEYQTMIHIFEGTGMRLKEVSFLEEGCVEKCKDGITLTFVPHKVSLSMRRRSEEEFHTVYISEELAKVIEHQETKTKELGEKHGHSYIFLVEDRGYPKVLGNTFNRALNRLATKYDICDLDGSRWKFDARQMRATVAATMIENGATEAELMQQLNHKSQVTSRTHYQKVENRKLAEMTSEWFEKEFEIKVGKDNLVLYTEEERRALYVDFKLSKRDVEFGKCGKHPSEGSCGRGTGKVSCTNCTKICTGKQYLNKWVDLAENQSNIVKELQEGYLSQGIPKEIYETFIEYKRDVNQLKIYESAIKAIQEG